MRLIDRSVLPGFLTGPSCLLAGLSRLLAALDRAVSPPLGQFASASPWPDCPVDRGAVLSCAGGWIVRAGHAALKWSCRPDSAVAAGPDDERGLTTSGAAGYPAAPLVVRPRSSSGPAATAESGRQDHFSAACPARTIQPPAHDKTAPRSTGQSGQGDALANWPKGGLTARSRAAKRRDRPAKRQDGPVKKPGRTDRSIKRTGDTPPYRLKQKKRGPCALHTAPLSNRVSVKTYRQGTSEPLPAG